MFKKTLVAVAAFSLAATPVLAQSQAPIQPDSEQAQGSELRGRGVILPLAVIIALILGILALTDTWPFDEDPHSP
jgi:nucleoside recognition membrane protein YjiH